MRAKHHNERTRENSRLEPGMYRDNKYHSFAHFNEVTIISISFSLDVGVEDGYTHTTSTLYAFLRNIVLDFFHQRSKKQAVEPREGRFRWA